MKKRIFDKSSFWLSVIFVVAAALIFFLMALTYKHLEKQSSSSDGMTHSYEVSLRLLNVYSNLKDIETERRNYILNRKQESLQTIEERRKNNENLFKSLNTLVGEHEEQTEHLKSLEMMAGYHQKLVAQTLNSSRTDFETGTLPNTTALLAGKNVMSSIRDQIDLMMSTEQYLITQRKDELLFRQQSTPIYLFVISLFSLGLLVFAFFKINRDVKNQRRINNELMLAVDTSKLAEKVGEYGIWTYDSEDDTFKFSDNEYRLLGYKPQEFEATYENFMKHVHPEDLEAVNRKSKAMLAHGNMESFRYRVIRKDGSQAHFQVMGKSMQNSSGQTIMLGITTDVTREIEDQLKLEGINWMLTEKNRVLSITNETSQEAEKIGEFGTVQWFPYDDQMHFSENLYRLFNIEKTTRTTELEQFLAKTKGEDQALLRDKIRQIRDTRQADPFTFRIVEEHRPVRWFSANSKFITAEDENSHYMLIIITDVSEYVEAEEQLLEQNRILEGNNKELQAFNYVASHDLQEPLRKIETFISRLVDKDSERLSESGKQYIERIHLSAGRMRKLINDLLQFSRTTRTEQTFEITELNDLVHNSLDELHAKIEEKNAEITVDRLPSLKVVPFQIQQMFTNLISNSLKYSAPEQKVKISVVCKRVSAAHESRLPKGTTGDFFKFEFKDNGIGFENQYAERIFELFNRLHGRLEYEGTGIGLAICKKIVENHQGFIYAESTTGQGATFTVLLPETLQK